MGHWLHPTAGDACAKSSTGCMMRASCWEGCGKEKQSLFLPLPHAVGHLCRMKNYFQMGEQRWEKCNSLAGILRSNSLTPLLQPEIHEQFGSYEILYSNTIINIQVHFSLMAFLSVNREGSTAWQMLIDKETATKWRVKVTAA